MRKLFLYGLVFVAVFMVCIASARTGKATANTTLIENFEHTFDLRYDENDSNADLSGGLDTQIAADTNSYKLLHASGYSTNGDEQQVVVKNVDFTNAENIRFTWWYSTADGGFGEYFKVLVDSTQVYFGGEMFVKAVPFKVGDIENSLSGLGLTGVHEVIFRVYYTINRASQNENFAVWVDNLALDYTIPNMPPNKPTNLLPSVRQTTTNVAISSVVTDNNTNNINVYFYDNLTKSLIDNVWIASGGTAQVTWSGLVWGSTYTFFARGQDADGWGENSETQSFAINSLVVINNTRSDNYLLDNAAEWSSTGVVTTTRIYTDVEFGSSLMVLKENVFFRIYDNTAALVVIKQAVDNTRLSDNKQRFSCLYSSLDNSLPYAKLGGFVVNVYASDNTPTTDNRLAYNVFYVDSLGSTPTIDNAVGHKIRVTGTIARSKSGAVVSPQVWIVDSNLGTLYQDMVGANFDNTFTVSAGGNLRIKLKAENLDGWGDNLIYTYPDMAPGLANISTSQSLVDRDQDVPGSSAVLTTVVTATFEDNDGAVDITSAFIAWRDNANTIIENRNVYSTKTIENENKAVFTVTINPDDNTLDVRLGPWDVAAHVLDSFGKMGGNNFGAPGASLFTVDDWRVLDNFALSPSSPFYARELSVTGTSQRYTCTVTTITSGTFTDNKEGVKTIGVGTSWKVSYFIANSKPLDNNKITVKIQSATLDGIYTSSYIVSAGAMYDVEVRWEENGCLVFSGENMENRLLTVYTTATDNYANTFWVNATISNLYFTVKPYLMELRDINDNYSRTRIPTYENGTIIFWMTASPTRYDFTLVDYTSWYSPVYNSQLIFKRRSRENLMVINESYWNTSYKTGAFLIRDNYYQIYVKGKQGFTTAIDESLMGDTTSRDIIIYDFPQENSRIIKDYIAWSAYRIGTYIAVTYRDNTGDTTTSTVNVYDWKDVLQTTSAFDNSDWNYLWTGSSGDNIYYVSLTINHENFGIFTEEWVVSGTSMWIPNIPPAGGLENIIGNVGTQGGTVSIVQLAAFGFLCLVAVSFGAAYASTGMLIISFVAVMLQFMGWFNLPGGWTIPMALLVFSILWKLTEGGGNI